MEFSLFGKLLIIYLICKTVSCNFTILFITFVNQYSPHYVTPDFDSLQFPPEPGQQRIPARRDILLHLAQRRHQGLRPGQRRLRARRPEALFRERFTSEIISSHEKSYHRMPCSLICGWVSLFDKVSVLGDQTGHSICLYAKTYP